MYQTLGQVLTKWLRASLPEPQLSRCAKFKSAARECVALFILFDGLTFYKLLEIARNLRDFHPYVQMNNSLSGRYNICTQLISDLIIQ